MTGGEGYFGSILARRLIEQGYECRVLDLVDSGDRPDEIEFMQGDIRNESVVSEACEGVDVVFHNVAKVPLEKNKEAFRSINIGGVRMLLECSEREGVEKIVYTSSSAVYGIPEKNPVTEDDQPKPDEAYGQAKYEGEVLCRDYSERGMDISIIRPRTILGPGRGGIFQVLFEWVRRGKNLPVLGNGENVYQFVHADDLARACILAGERAGSADYNCGAEQFGMMRATLEALCDHAGTGSRIQKVPKRPAEWGMKIASALRVAPLAPYHALMYGRSLYFDTSKAKTELGWETQWSNEAMMVDSYDWYCENVSRMKGNSDLSHHRSSIEKKALGVVEWFL